MGPTERVFANQIGQFCWQKSKNFAKLDGFRKNLEIQSAISVLPSRPSPNWLRKISKKRRQLRFGKTHSTALFSPQKIRTFRQRSWQGIPSVQSFAQQNQSLSLNFRVKKWICYGKRVGSERAENSLTELTKSNFQNEKDGRLEQNWEGMTKIVYDQQNLIQCFEQRNFYRFLFAFFCSLGNPFTNQFRNRSAFSMMDKSDKEIQLQRKHKENFPLFWQSTESQKLSRKSFQTSLFSPHVVGDNQRFSTKKMILFGRSELKRLFRKILFIRPESLLFAQIFLIPLAGFFGIVYTFWTFSVSSTTSLKEYIPIAHQRVNPLTKRLSPDFRNAGPAIENHSLRNLDFQRLSGLEAENELKDLTYFTSYKVDWSPTRGLSEFLRFTNTASKIFILWASLTVFRSLRPVKANRPEMRIQTRFLRPFQNRKRFHDLEGIEKFSGVLTTLTESIQGSFKDPLFYLVLAMPNLPFFQPFQKAIGKFRFFLFYGKETEFVRKPISVFLGIISPKEKQKQAQTYPKGYLFIGPPGTGKTLLAQAIAGESKVNFICLSASEIQKQIDIGTRIGALRLRNLFEEARTLTPCILFLDEIDTLGRARQRQSTFTRSNQRSSLHSQGTGQTKHESKSFSSGGIESTSTNQVGIGGQESRTGAPGRTLATQNHSDFNGEFHSFTSIHRMKGLSPTKWGRDRSGSQPLESHERKNKLSEFGQEIDLKLFTEFLVQMDSFSVKDGFLVIGTTNFLSSLDPAFIRSGRFDRILGLTYPPKQTRIAILKLHIRKKGNFFDTTIPWNIFGMKTKDLSPADLAKVINESSLYLLKNSRNLAQSKSMNQTEAPKHNRSQTMLPLLTPEKELSNVRKKSLLKSILKDLFFFQPGLIHTSRSLREGLVKILESKKV